MACPSKSLTCTNASKTVWPSGLRRWLQVPVRKGVGSNPTAVTFQLHPWSLRRPGKSLTHSRPTLLYRRHLGSRSHPWLKPDGPPSGALPIASMACSTIPAKTVWPSGLRRWLQAPVRKGVGSNSTAVTFQLHLRFLAGPGASLQHPRPRVLYRRHFGFRSGPRLKPERPPPSTNLERWPAHQNL